MKLTFELPEGLCENTGDMCPYVHSGDCVVDATPSDPLGHELDATPRGFYVRRSACPFHGVVTVTMEDEDA